MTYQYQMNTYETYEEVVSAVRDAILEETADCALTFRDWLNNNYNASDIFERFAQKNYDTVYDDLLVKWVDDSFNFEWDTVEQIEEEEEYEGLEQGFDPFEGGYTYDC